MKVGNYNNHENKLSKETLDQYYLKGNKIEGTFVDGIDYVALLKQYEKYFIWEVDRNLQQLLSISMGLYEKVSLLEFPKDPSLLESFMLEDENILVIIIFSSLIDANLYTDHDGYEKIISYTGENKRVHFLLNNTFDDFYNKIKLDIRFSLHTLIGILWDRDTNRGNGAHVIKLSLNRNELFNDK